MNCCKHLRHFSSTDEGKGYWSCGYGSIEKGVVECGYGLREDG